MSLTHYEAVGRGANDVAGRVFMPNFQSSRQNQFQRPRLVRSLPEFCPPLNLHAPQSRTEIRPGVKICVGEILHGDRF